MIADLQQAVFGKRPSRPSIVPVAKQPPKSKKPRNPASYRRPPPKQSDITHRQRLVLSETCQCGGHFQHKEVVTYVEEDIPLAGVTVDYLHKLITEYQVEKGVCQQCGQPQVAGNYNLRGQRVRLGDNVKLLICTLVSQGLTYNKIIELLKILYNLQVSSGEITRILKVKAEKWQGASQGLLADVKASPYCSMDETPWSIRQENG